MEIIAEMYNITSVTEGLVHLYSYFCGIATVNSSGREQNEQGL